MGETELEMVRRHIREGQAYVARQREIVASLPLDSDFAQPAREALVLFEQFLAMHRQHLARLLR